MAYYLVKGNITAEHKKELRKKLENEAFKSLRPFGKALTYSLKHARIWNDNRAVWEEEDYCTPPLAQERKAVLDHYFDQLEIDSVAKGEGWKQIEDRPYLFPALINAEP